MRSEPTTITASDGTELATYRWLPDGEPKAVVQLAHGMAEHMARYDDLARHLTDAGYAVYAIDFRGHGKTAPTSSDLGYFGDGDGWQTVVGDMATLGATIAAERPGLKVFLLGHSMGSMLTRSYAMTRPDVAGMVLSGTSGSQGALGSVGKLIAQVECRIRGRNASSKLMDKLTFGQFNAAFKPARTNFDWLSRDPAQVDAYVADPLSGNVHSAGFFVDLLGGLAKINDPANVAKLDKQLPIFVFSGEQDPVAGKQAGAVRKVVQQFRNAGIRDVTEKYYPEARHEMFNETNRDEVYADVIGWLDEHLDSD